MYTIKLEKFEGPLDLLLSLIEGEEMNISEISLAHVTDQYISHLEEMDDMNPSEMADFLVIAAKLLWIKSKTLLPNLEGEEMGESDLAAQLKIYKEYRDASLLVHEMILKKRFSFFRERLPFAPGEVFFNPPPWLTGDKLAMVLKEIIDDLEPIVRLPRGVVKNTVSIQEKIQHIRNLIREKIEIRFHSVIAKAKNKVEVIVNFLAVLELLKQRHIVVTQEKMFGEINIKKGDSLIK